MGDVEATRDVFLHSCFGFMAIGVLLYDHVITLADEIVYIWKRPKFTSSFLFLLNRYTASLGNIAVTIVSFQSLPSEVRGCKRYTFFRQLLLVINQVIVCILLTLRTYALYGRNNRLLAFMVGFGAVLVAAAAWALVGQHSYAATNVSGCHIAYTTSTGIHLAVAWEALFLYDTSMLILTLLKTYKATRQHGLLSFNGRLNIVTLICRDGAMYFAIMAIANFSNILTFYIASSLLKGTLSTFASCISVTLMTRLMLNLHKSADTGILTTHANIDTGGMVFTSRIISTLGPSHDAQNAVLIDLSPIDAPRLSTDIYLELRDIPAQNHLQVRPHEV